MAVSRLQTWIDDAKHRKGRWRLTHNHEVQYQSEGLHEEFSIRGPIVAAEAGRLLFAATEKTADQKTVTRLLKLDGQWSVDNQNRILFSVEKESGRSDELTFASGWRLGNQYEILYSYKETALKKRRKLERELSFSGQWDLSEKNRLVFLIGGDEQSRLRFRGAFQTPSILARSGEIRYQVGVEGRRGQQPKTLVFFGKWKLSRTLGLSFELESGEKRQRVWSFGGEWSVDRQNRVAIQLHSLSGQRLGVEVVFSRNFFKDGEIFLRIRRAAEESRIEAGARWTA